MGTTGLVGSRRVAVGRFENIEGLIAGFYEVMMIIINLEHRSL